MTPERLTKLAAGLAAKLEKEPDPKGFIMLGAAWFLGEPMHWNLLAGLALVTGGILFGVRQARSAAAQGVKA